MSQDISTVTQEVQDPFIDGVIQNCKKCDLPIYEGHAYELGDDRWHIDCFKCSKCNSSLGCNSNFLVLGNGNLICSNCSYNCKQCGKKIDDLAILTGDQAYCSSCFKCRSCKQKIEDLRYARTSKGLFCMNCHEKLMAKKKKYDLKKKQQLQLKYEQEKDRERLLERQKDDNLSTHSRTSRTSKTSNTPSFSGPNSALLTPVMEEEKPLYQPRPQPASSLQSQSDLYDLYDRSRSPTPKLSKHSSVNDLYRHVTNSSSALSRDKDLPLTPELQQLNAANRRTPPTSTLPDNDTTPKASMPPPVPRIEREYSIEEINDSDDELNQRDKSKNNNRGDGVLQPAVELRHPSNDQENISPDYTKAQPNLGSPTSISHTKFQGKDLLTMSPHQGPQESDDKSIENVPHSQNDPNTTHTFTHSRGDQNLLVDYMNRDSGAKSPETNEKNGRFVESRSNCPSPLARANRHARVLETNEAGPEQTEEDLDELEDPNPAFTTPKKKTAASSVLTSPPPRVPLPSVPAGLSTPGGHSRSNLQPYNGHFKTNSQSSDQYFMEKATSDDFLNGLGLEGIDYNEYNDLQRGNSNQLKGSRVIVNPSPSVTNLEESPAADSLGRKSSIIRTPRLGIRHKRSISGGSNGGSANSSISKLNFFKGRDERGHSRHVSDGSISGSYTYVLNNNNNYQNPNISGGGNVNYITPPLPSTYRTDFYHNRSSSDTAGHLGHTKPENSELATYDTHVKGLRSEVQQLETIKAGLLTDIRKLKDDKTKFSDEIETLRAKYNEEFKLLNNLNREISELKLQKGDLEKSSPELDDDVSTAVHSQHKQNHQSHHPSDSQSSTQGVAQMHHLAANASNHKSNSSSSLLAGTPEFHDDVEPQKATKLKFWRRAKIGFNNATGPNAGGYNPANSGNLSVPNSGANTGASPHKNDDDESGKKGFGLMAKSRSTNILDSFLNNNPGQGEGDSETTSLFNCSIEKRAKLENSPVPLIISRCIKEVEERGLEFEGIYRISGGNLTIISIEQAFTNYNFAAKDDTKQVNKLNELLDCDINAVTSALKRYLRKIPDPLIPFDIYNDFIKLNSITAAPKKIGDFKSRVIDRLPNANREVLYMLCKHLELVNLYSSINRMNYKNLSVVFAPTIARDETGQREMMDMGNRNDITEFLLNNYNQIFSY